MSDKNSSNDPVIDTKADELISSTTASNLNGTQIRHLMFLETTAAQGIAGAFVWMALILTCHQVCTILRELIFF